MSNQETNPTKYSQDYFSKPLPPTHNPIIGYEPLDTISNVYDALCCLRRLYEAPDCELEEDAKTGLFILQTCLIQGLRFEIENRS